MSNRPHGNICNWPEIEQRKLRIELRTNQLIIGLRDRKITRREIELERNNCDSDLRDYFTDQLNHWLKIYKLRNEK